MQPRRGNAVAAAAFAACSALILVAMLGGSQKYELEDKDAAEIAKLQREKVSLMAELSSQFTPQDQQKLTYTPPAPHAAAAHKAKKAVQRSKMDVKTLAAEKVALMKQLEGYKSESMSDPVVGGILAQFATDKGIGPLGEVKDTKEDMMGSLSAARESRKQRLHLLKMMAESMGDVSPKEALAQRVISIGSHFAKGRQQLIGKEGEEHLDWIQPGSSHNAEAHSTRIGYLEKEVEKAKRVEDIERELKAAKKSLEEETAKEDETLSKAPEEAAEPEAGGEYEGEGEFAVAQREARSFVGEKAWEAKKQASLDDGCRFRRDCHAQGYVKGGLVVGDAHFTGPDRYGADGAGPQMMKGKVGDNVVDVGIMGSAGTDDGDVMVPTGVSGARGRDLIRRRDAKDKGFPTLEDPVRRELVHGAAVARYGGPKHLGIVDEKIPISSVEATAYRARTQQLDMAPLRQGEPSSVPSIVMAPPM